MPRYDYRCIPCLIVEEKTHLMSEEPEFICANCGSVMHKVIHPTPIIFNGTGFYKTGG